MTEYTEGRPLSPGRKAAWSIVPYLFAGALFALFACNNLLTRGMFMDGLLYTSVAANLAEGVGTPWQLVCTQTIHTPFFEHPPLMMWMLSLWFRLFGVSMAAAKAYSAAVVLLTATLMVAVWRRLGFGLRLGWLPLLMFALIPDVPLSAHNNYLESTMAVFVLLSVWLVLRGGGVGWHLLAGCSVALALLTKGPVGLFPLAMPLLLLLFGERRGVWTMVRGTGAMLVGAVVPLAVVWYACPGAADYLGRYFERQIQTGIHEPVAQRTYILKAFISRTAIVLVIALVAGLWPIVRKGCGWRVPCDGWRRAGILFALSLCGTLPMMISTKQRAFYLLTVFPFVALSAAAVAEPVVRHIRVRISNRAVVAATAVVVAAAIVLNAMHYGKAGRDEALLSDMDIIAPHLVEGETVSIPQALASHYSLHGYYYFCHRVSLDKQRMHPHLLTDAGGLRGDWADAYREVPLGTAEYRLYERVAE